MRKKLGALLALALLAALTLLLWPNGGSITPPDGTGEAKAPLLGGMLLPSELEDGEVPLTGLPDDLPIEATPEEREAARRAEYVQEVLRLVNEAREEAGLAALTLDEALCTAAQTRAAECVGTFSHTRPDGTSYKTVLAEVDVTASWTGENLATGHTTPALVVERWLQSEGHRANILNEHYSKIGIGLEKNVGNRYKGYAWAQLFTE